MAIEIMDMDASEVAETPAAPAMTPRATSQSESQRRLERTLRRHELRIARRMAD